MPVNGCWIANGKLPEHESGASNTRAALYTPALIPVLDGRACYLVDWSLSRVENAITVADAWRYAIQHHDKPLLAYSDNSNDETNKMLDADITGIFFRLGIKHITGIPDNPQAGALSSGLTACYRVVWPCAFRPIMD